MIQKCYKQSICLLLVLTALIGLLAVSALDPDADRTVESVKSCTVYPILVVCSQQTKSLCLSFFYSQIPAYRNVAGFRADDKVICSDEKTVTRPDKLSLFDLNCLLTV